MHLTCAKNGMPIYNRDMTIGILGKRLKTLRLAKDLSQGQVAEFAGVSQSTLSDIENGKIAPKTLGVLVALAGYHQVSLDYLVGLTDDPTPRAVVAALPAPLRAVINMALQWPAARQQELFGHAQVLHTAQRVGNLAEYDRLMGMFAAAEDGPYRVAAIEDLLRAATAGDRATAERMLADIIAGRGWVLPAVIEEHSE